MRTRWRRRARYNASSGINSLPGKIKSGGITNLLGLNSAETLAGKGAAVYGSSVTTNLSGRVVAVLPSGNLVVEAERVINMNHEKQTIMLRGVVRRGDIGPNNMVASDCRRRSRTGDQGQGRGLGRRAPAPSGSAHHLIAGFLDGFLSELMK